MIFVFFLSRYLNVFKFVILDLSAKSRRVVLKYWCPVLEAALTEAEAGWDMCVELAADCPGSQEVALLVQAVKTSDICIVRTAPALAAVSRSLHKEQPKSLVVEIPAEVPSPPELKKCAMKVKKHHKGNLSLILHHSYASYIPSDEIALLLGNAE